MLSRLLRLLWPLVLVAGALGVLALAIYLFGLRHNPVEALTALYKGAFGSVYALTSTAERATILIFYALGIVISFRAGLFNIGSEGQARIGAIAATALTVTSIGPRLAALGFPAIPIILVCGALTGALWSLFAGLLRRWRGVPEVISTLMLNFIALSLALFLLAKVYDPSGNVTPGPLQEAKGTYQQSDTIPIPLQLQTWGATRFHSGIFLILPALLLAHVYLFRTPGGMALRAVGLNPIAARACGVRVAAVELRTFAIAGALAGLGGAMGVLVRSRLDTAPYPAGGYGFMAIAVALVADLKPLWVLPAAILFAGLEVGSARMEGNAGIAREVVYVIDGMLILLVLIRHVGGWRTATRGEAA